MLFELDHNSAKSFEAFFFVCFLFFFFYISKLETWGEIKGQNIQWKGRWVLTFGKEGFLKSLLSLQDEVRKADPGSSVSLRQADSQNSLPPPAVMKCRGKEREEETK